MSKATELSLYLTQPLYREATKLNFYRERLTNEHLRNATMLSLYTEWLPKPLGTIKALLRLY